MDRLAAISKLRPVAQEKDRLLAAIRECSGRYLGETDPKVTAQLEDELRRLSTEIQPVQLEVTKLQMALHHADAG